MTHALGPVLGLEVIEWQLDSVHLLRHKRNHPRDSNKWDVLSQTKNSVMRCSLPRQHNRRRNITNSKCNVLIFKEQLVYSTSTLTIPSSRPKTVLTSEPSRMSERGSGNKDMSMCVTMWLYLSQGLEILPNKKQKKNDDFMKSNLKSLVDELFIK